MILLIVNILYVTITQLTLHQSVQTQPNTYCRLQITKTAFMLKLVLHFLNVSLPFINHSL